MEKNARAIQTADFLLATLIEKQPGLFQAVKTGSDGGANLGDFIAALRHRLIEMYEEIPRQ